MRNSTKVVTEFSISSLVAYLDKVWYGTPKEKVWAQIHNKQQQHNPITFKGWKKCSNSNNSVSDGT